MNNWCESCARKNVCYAVTPEPACFVPITNSDSNFSELTFRCSLDTCRHYKNPDYDVCLECYEKVKKAREGK